MHPITDNDNDNYDNDNYDNEVTPINTYNNTNSTNIYDYGVYDNLFFYLASGLLLYSVGCAIYRGSFNCKEMLNSILDKYRDRHQLSDYLLSREIVETDESSERGSSERGSIESLDEGDCSICLEYFSPRQISITLPCNHKFHSQCITEWLHKELICPNCRAPVEI